jgi:hypothetical protein
MGISPGLSAFRLAFEICPIIFQGGIAQSIGAGYLPIISITESLNFVDGLISGGDPLDFDDFFAHFVPLPGSSLYRQTIGKYPFANQAVAANAVIQQPTNISLRMICPVKLQGGYAVKLAIITLLQMAIKAHCTQGGTFIVATPSFFWMNCIHLDLTDVSSIGEDKQSQHTFQWDFEAPLLTVQDAVNAQSGLMSQLTSGTPLSGDPSTSGAGQALGQPQSIASPASVGAAQGVPAASTATPTLNAGVPD